MTRAFVFTVVALAAGFSGLAMLAYILTPASLVDAELVAIAASAIALAIVVARAPGPVLRDVARTAAAGLAVGAVATLVYDDTRTALSLLDPSPYDPFEAIRQFGIGVVSASAPPATILAAGFVVHLINGSTFGVIYAMFARNQLSSRRTALVSGMGWGVVLEVIQSILYPGWLGITTVIKEFLLISAAGHLVYGALLGLGVRGLLLARTRRTSAG